MKIGIIGAGQIGGTLTRRFRAVGHEVFVANSRGPETLAQLATETGAHAVTSHEAARAGDVVVVTIPEINVPNLPRDLFAGVRDEVVIVDTGNYYPRQRDGRIDEIESGMPESRWVELQLGRPIVKAFNNIAAQHLLNLGKRKGTPGRVALPVAGDRAKDKKLVMQLIDEIGFDPVDAGALSESWRLQPATPVHATDLDAEGVRRALAEAKNERKPEWRATQNSTSTLVSPTQIVQEYFKAFQSGDVEKALGMLTDDVVWHVQGAPNVPTVGVRHGKEEVRKWIVNFPLNFKQLNFEVGRTFESGNEIIITGRFRLLVLPTRREVGSELAIHFILRDGKIASYKILEDSYALHLAFR